MALPFRLSLVVPSIIRCAVCHHWYRWLFIQLIRVQSIHALVYHEWFRLANTHISLEIICALFRLASRFCAGFLRILGSMTRLLFVVERVVAFLRGWSAIFDLGIFDRGLDRGPCIMSTLPSRATNCGLRARAYLLWVPWIWLDRNMLLVIILVLRTRRLISLDIDVDIPD